MGRKYIVCYSDKQVGTNKTLGQIEVKANSKEEAQALACKKLKGKQINGVI